MYTASSPSHYIHDTQPHQLYATGPKKPHSSRAPGFHLSFLAPTAPLPASVTPPVTPPQHDERGRMLGYIENDTQRKERVEFLRRRESARRVAKWVDELTEDELPATEAPKKAKLLPHIPDKSTGHSNTAQYAAKAEQEEPYIIYNTGPNTRRSVLGDMEDEPYVIYVSSPKAYPSSSPLPYAPPSPPPTYRDSFSDVRVQAPLTQNRHRRRSSSTHSRHSSLEIISEEEEFSLN